MEEKTRDQEAREKVETWLKESEARPEQNLGANLSFFVVVKQNKIHI